MNKINKLYLKIKYGIKDAFTHSISDNSGMGVVEIVLIILVLVGLVVIFRNQITSLIAKIFSRVNSEVDNF